MNNKLQRFGRALANNWGLKLLALLLAALSFFAIRGATSFEERYDVPVEVKVEPGIAILDQNPRTVEVAVRGSREDLARLDETDIRAVVRCKASDPAGSERVHIRSRDIEGVRGARIERIRPNIVMLTFDREAEKEVPVVKPKTVGQPLIGKAELSYEPKTVRIRGPMRRLTIDEVYTEPVDVSGRIESFTREVRVLPPGDTWVSRIEPSRVTVQVNITARTVERTWDAVPVLALVRPGGAYRVDIEPPAVTVTVKGRAEIVETLAADAIQVYANIPEVDLNATYELPVTVHLPAGVDLQGTAEPPTVKVTLRRR
ncbi:MAG: hypothetical protein JW951_08690 [Lentisphaerae bacterium]|nr:hypothetical protein [Lentisphaerota bacterium]